MDIEFVILLSVTAKTDTVYCGGTGISFVSCFAEIYYGSDRAGEQFRPFRGADDAQSLCAGRIE